MDPQICDAIENSAIWRSTTMAFRARSNLMPTGYPRQGKEVVRGYQTGGQSSSGPLGGACGMWRKWNRCEYASLPSPAPAPAMPG